MPAFEKGFINHALLSFDCINYSEGYRFIIEILDAKQNIQLGIYLLLHVKTSSSENIQVIEFIIKYVYERLHMEILQYGLH